MSCPESKQIGIVVVGLGIAGKVRVRDLKERTSCLRLRGVVSRRQLELEDVKQLSLDDALNSDDVDAVMICTEPALHEGYSRQALEKGKHVLVEYPVALSAETARQLYKLAEDKGLVLYEENIALLTEGFLAAKEKASAVDLREAKYSLTGSFNGWIEDFQKSGLPFIPGVSGLQTMLSLFGDLVVKGGKMEKSDDNYKVQAWLETQKGSPIEITLERTKSKEARRCKQVVFEFEDGEIIDTSKIPQKASKKGLFMQDMDIFEQLVLRGAVPEESKNLSLKSLEIAEQIHSHF